MKPALSTDEEWGRFAANLALCLADLDEDEFLIVSAKRMPCHYLQFAGQGHFGMWVEAASNAFIEPPEAQLTAQDYTALTDMGWRLPKDRPPQEADEPRDPEGPGNFFLDLGVPVDCEALAALAIRTIREVYGVRHPGMLEYTAFGRDNTQIRFSNLLIKRHRD